MAGGEVFPIKSKHQYHLSQWWEYAYGGQSWKERRLLCECMFIPIDWWNLILKDCGKKRFSYKNKASMSFIPIRGMCLWFPIMKKKRLLLAFVFILIDRWRLILKYGGKWSFSYETKV